MPSLHDLPIAAIGFRFLLSDSQPDHAVLEFDTIAEPIRLFLTHEQIEKLGTDVGVVAAKMASKKRISRGRPSSSDAEERGCGVSGALKRASLVGRVVGTKAQE